MIIRPTYITNYSDGGGLSHDVDLYVSHRYYAWTCMHCRKNQAGWRQSHVRESEDNRFTFSKKWSICMHSLYSGEKGEALEVF